MSITDDRTFSRSRIILLWWAILVMFAGLESRASMAQNFLPDIITPFAGDCLWAALVYLLLVIVWLERAPVVIAGRSLVFATAVEVSQLYRADWPETVRDLPGMRLVWGYGFLWSDLVCYFTGIAAVFLIDHLTGHSTSVKENPVQSLSE